MSKTINTALQELADVINNLPVEETASSRPEDKPQLNQAKTRGITDEDILNALVEMYRDEPDLVRRLQQDYLRNGGKLTK